MRKKLLEFRVQLSRQCLIVGKHQCRFVYSGNHIGNCKCFSRTGCPQQDLFLFSRLNSLDQFIDGLRLIALGLIAGNQFKQFILH